MSSSNNKLDTRIMLLNELVDEITRDVYDNAKVRVLVAKLGIAYSDDPMQLLNNVLKGIHIEGTPNEPEIQ